MRTCGARVSPCCAGDVRPADDGVRPRRPSGAHWRAAPQFTVTDGTQTVDLAKLRGRVVVAQLLGDLVRAVHRRAAQPGASCSGACRRSRWSAISSDEDAAAYRQIP